jgi:hypothetical protein
MQFSYKGFTQSGNLRLFAFEGIEEQRPAEHYCIAIDLALFTKFQLSFQSGPMFCLQILRSAALAGSDELARVKDYKALDSDFRSLQIERERRIQALANKRPAKRPIRKPPPSSQLRGLGTP